MELSEIKEAFEKAKQEAGFTSSFEDIDRIFFLYDFMQEKDFTSNKPARQIASRMTDVYSRIAEYLHRILMPNPHSLVVMEESKAFTDEEKKNVQKIFASVMELISRNSVNSMTLQDDGALIDDMVEYWKSTVETEVLEYFKKSNMIWKNNETPEKKKPTYSG